MQTGHQQDAARALSIFARVEPQHKSQLVHILKNQVSGYLRNGVLCLIGHLILWC